MENVNLTQYLKAVGNPEMGVKPQGGYDLVVFRVVDGGQRFDRVVRNGDTMRKSWTELAASFVSYPASTNPRLSHQFSRLVDHVSPGHAYTIDCTFLFAVGNARTIVERLQDDPVRRLEAEVSRHLAESSRRHPWEAFKREVLGDGGTKLTEQLLAASIDGTSTEPRPQLRAYLQAFAEEHGIRLGSISIGWKLSARDNETTTTDIDVERDVHLIESRTRKEMAALKAKKDLEREELRLSVEANGIRRSEAFKDNLLKRVDEAMGTVVPAIDTPEKLERTLAVGQRMTRTELTPRLVGGAVVADGVLPVLPARASTSELGTVLREALDVLENLDVDPARKRELTAALLHLIAESYLNDPAGTQPLGDYKHRVVELLMPLTNALSSEQFSALKRISDDGLLKDRLA